MLAHFLRQLEENLAWADQSKTTNSNGKKKTNGTKYSCTEWKQIPHTYIMFIWIISLLICKYRHLFDAAILFKRICFSRKWEDGFIIRRQSWETQLSQIMNKEVKLCGNTSQTGFNQPRVEKVTSNSRTHKILLITLLQAHLKWDRIVHSVTHSNKSLTLHAHTDLLLLEVPSLPPQWAKALLGKLLYAVCISRISTRTPLLSNLGCIQNATLKQQNRITLFQAILLHKIILTGKIF